MNRIELGLRIDSASSFFRRLAGWLVHSDAPRDSALYFPRCNAVHTCFMRFAIDVVFVDRYGRVIRVVSGLQPWRASVCSQAFGALELAAGYADRAGIRPGMQVPLPFVPKTTMQ